jgi:UDP-GlcNAc:undecaprenyl-phosphate GlcNAc-1-phosphate transferase
MSLTHYFFLTLFLIGAELFYLQLARSIGWFDIPNERSAHRNSTIVRAGGFVFYLAGIAAIGIGKLDLLYFGLGLTAIAVVSFWDDLSSVPIRYRLVVHMLAVGLLLIQERVAFDNWFLVAGLLVLGVGIVNAYNFMDGINGMTAFYSLVTVGTLWCWKAQLPTGGTDSLFPCVFIALLIFSYVNARRQPICFAGDVGSISMGFIVLYGVLACISRSHTYLPSLFLSVYGVDTIVTIIHRLHRRETIFQAHRMHLFQLLVHQLGWLHLRVSFLYALVQAGINGLVLAAMNWSPINQGVLAVSVLGGLVIIYRWTKKRLDKLKETDFTTSDQLWLMPDKAIKKGRFLKTDPTLRKPN